MYVSLSIRIVIIIVVIRVFLVCASSVLLEPDIMPARRDLRSQFVRTSHSALCCTCRRCWLASPAFRQPGAKPLLGSFAFDSPVFSQVALCSCERFASCHAPPNMHRMSDRRAAHPVVACIAQSTVSVATWRNLRMSTSLALYERRSCTCVGMRYACAKQPR